MTKMKKSRSELAVNKFPEEMRKIMKSPAWKSYDKKFKRAEKRWKKQGITSEFGRGLVLNLVKFSEHYERRIETIHIAEIYISKSERDRKLMLSDNPPDELNYGTFPKEALKLFIKMANHIHGGDLDKSLSREYELLMNAASDHLYEIKVPEIRIKIFKWEWKFTRFGWGKIKEKVKELQSLGLEMGHGFRNDKIWKPRDFAKLFELSKEIALMIDKKIGIKDGDIGKW